MILYSSGDQSQSIGSLKCRLGGLQQMWIPNYAVPSRALHGFETTHTPPPQQKISR